MLRSSADGNPFCRLARTDGPQAQTVEPLSYRDFLDCNHPKRENGAPCSPPLVPAKAGTQTYGLRPLDSRFRGNERNFCCTVDNFSRQLDGMQTALQTAA